MYEFKLVPNKGIPTQLIEKRDLHCLCLQQD